MEGSRNREGKRRFLPHVPGFPALGAALKQAEGLLLCGPGGGQEGANNALKYPVFRGAQRLRGEEGGRERGDKAGRRSAVTFARWNAMWMM